VAAAEIRVIRGGGARLIEAGQSDELLAGLVLQDGLNLLHKLHHQLVQSKQQIAGRAKELQRSSE
jgi:hypothetical protein